MGRVGHDGGRLRHVVEGRAAPRPVARGLHLHPPHPALHLGRAVRLLRLLPSSSCRDIFMELVRLQACQTRSSPPMTASTMRSAETSRIRPAPSTAAASPGAAVQSRSRGESSSRSTSTATPIRERDLGHGLGKLHQRLERDHALQTGRRIDPARLEAQRLGREIDAAHRGLDEQHEGQKRHRHDEPRDQHLAPGLTQTHHRDPLEIRARLDHQIARPAPHQRGQQPLDHHQGARARPRAWRKRKPPSR